MFILKCLLLPLFLLVLLPLPLLFALPTVADKTVEAS